MTNPTAFPGHPRPRSGLIAGLLVCLLARSAEAAPTAASAAPTALDRLAAARAAGAIGPAEHARQVLDYLFDRARMDPAWAGREEPPLRCGTVELARLAAAADLDPDVRELLGRRLRTSPAATAGVQAIGVHETAHFRIEYDASGPDAPPAADASPANGVPDFVEWTGDAAEASWAVEVDQLGYRAPQLQGGQGGRYLIQYQAQSGYGYTLRLNEQQRTKIVLHPSYAGFPANDDPDGDVRGSLRIAVAHELKHAIQIMYTAWTEGSWLELDATWMEDVVFDQVNDYVHRLGVSGSPFSQPQVSLDAGGAASAEDCAWQHYLTERHGHALMLDFWERRAVFPGQLEISTYREALAALGVGLPQAFGEFATWNAASGARAGAGFGYGEAATYPTPPPTTTATSLPVASGTLFVAHLAAHVHLVSNAGGGLAGVPEFGFAGYQAQGVGWAVTVVLGDLQGSVGAFPLTLVAAGDTLRLNGVDWAELEWAALVVANATDGGPALPYSFSVRAVAPILITHDPLGPQADDGLARTIRAAVKPGTAAVAPASVRLAWRSGGTIATVPMTPTTVADEYAATIPGQPVGTTVEYRVEAESVLGAAAATPALPGAFHAYVTVSVFEPFEVAGEWTAGTLGDDATGGLWQRAAPAGTSAAPYEDATLAPGTVCFVTGNGAPGGAAGAADVDDGSTTLTSPVFGFHDGGGYVRAEVRYRRWYSNHIGGLFDDTWRVEASNDGGATWVVVETVDQGRNEWETVTVDLLAMFGPPAQVRFRFVATDTGIPSLVEAALDDFAIEAVLADPVAVAAGAESGLRLGAALPNPATGRVRWRLTLPRPAPVQARVVDVGGRTIRRLIPEGASLAAGVHDLRWDGRDQHGRPAGAGVYTIDVVAGEERLRRKVTWLR